MSQQEKWLGFGNKQTQPESDSESLQERIQKLLSLDPTSLGLKKDKFASTNIVKPTGDIKRQLNKGYFDPSCTLMLGSARTPGFSYYHSYFNIDNVKLGDLVLHVYGRPTERPAIEDTPGLLCTVHSHSRDEYCPWKGGCHVLLSRISCRVHKNNLPNWFTDMWKELYEYE